MAKVLTIGIKEGNGPNTKWQYKNRVSMSDWTLLVLIFKDIEMYGAPIRKACQRFLEEKEKVFPI